MTYPSSKRVRVPSLDVEEVQAIIDMHHLQAEAARDSGETNEAINRIARAKQLEALLPPGE